MPSFLTKVFGRKKDDKGSPRRVEETGLLDGKFEAVSPSATKFPEVANERQPRHKERDKSFHVFRSKSRPSSPESKDKRVEVPHLSLNLPHLKGEGPSRELGAVFEADPESQILTEEAIGSRRLTPLETLLLVRACSEAIIGRGLETLGVMHPHWHSASPEVQRKLISLFLKSLAPQPLITTLSPPTPSAIVNAFDSEISSTQSPHDVAAVLRWGLRHLQLDGTSFGNDDMWYKTFFDAERSAGYPPNGYSTTLAPLLPTTHLELLTATLEVFSSLAAHAEANGISGSKLSKFFGLWLLAVERVQSDDDWSTFYARWESTGRILEHLFLARIRDDATASRMPTRLLELVKRYPYQTDPTANLLARPRFSTTQYDALFVRIETELSDTVDQPSHHPLQIILEAFKAEASSDAGEHAALWESIRKAGANEGSASPSMYPGLSNVFADETLRFFSLVPVESGAGASRSPSFKLYTRSSRQRSFSLGDKDATSSAAGAASSSVLPGHSKTPTSPLTASDVNSPLGVDWVTFSTSGFLDDTAERLPLASTLMEKERDMEVTIPRPSSPRLNLFTGVHKSSDTPRTLPKVEEPKPSSSSPASTPTVKTVSKSTHVSLVELDEAFIDFWSDALFDPISSSWPAFIICRLKNAENEVAGKRIEWLVLEQTFKRPPPPSAEASTSSHSQESSRHTRPSSPNSNKSDGSFTFSSTFLKRFSIFTSPGKRTTSLPSDKAGTKGKGKRKMGGPRVGEMGEMLREEDEEKEKTKVEKQKDGKKDEVVRVRVPSPKPKKSVDAAAVKKSLDEGSKTNRDSLTARAVTFVATGASVLPEVVKAQDATPAPTPAPVAEPITNGASVESVVPVAPVLAPELAVSTDTPVPRSVKEAAPQEEMANGSAAVQHDDVFETGAVQPVVEESKVAEPEVLSAVAEAESSEPSILPISNDSKVLEPEVVPVVDEVKAPEPETALVEQADDPNVVRVVEDAKASEPEVTPMEETLGVESKAESLVEEPEVAHVIEGTQAPELATAVVEEVKSIEPEVNTAIEEDQPFEPAPIVQVLEAVDEVRTVDHEGEPILEEAKAAEAEVAPIVEAKAPEPVEEARAPEPEVESTVDEIKAHELEAMSAVKEGSDSEVASPVEETKVLEPVLEDAMTGPGAAPAVEEAGPISGVVVVEAVVPAVLAAGAAIAATHDEAIETTSKDFFDEPREVDPKSKSLAEPIVESSVSGSEPVQVAQESQTAIEQVTELAEITDVSEPFVSQVVETATEPIVEETVELATESVAEEAIQSAVPEVDESLPEEASESRVIEETAEPVIEDTVEPAEVTEPVEASTRSPAEPLIQEAVQSDVPEVYEPMVEEAIHAEEVIVEETAARTVVEEIDNPLIEETTEPAPETVVEPVVEQELVEQELATEEVAEPEPLFDEATELAPETVVEPVVEQEVELEEVADPEPIFDEVPTLAIESEFEAETPVQVEVAEEPRVVVEESEEVPVVEEDSKQEEASSAPPTPIVEETPIDPTVELVAEQTSDPVSEEQTPALEQESDTAVVEASIDEPTVESEHTIVVEEAVVEGSTAVVEAVTETPTSVKEEVAPAVEDLTFATEEPEPVPVTSDKLAEENTESENVPTEEELAPIVEEPTLSADTIEDVECTSASPHEEISVLGVEHSVSVVELERQLEVEEPPPIQLVGVAQETDVLEDSAEDVLAPAEQVTSATIAAEPDNEAEAYITPVEAKAVPITVELSAAVPTDIASPADQPVENVDVVKTETPAPASTEQSVPIMEEPQPEVESIPIDIQPTSAELSEAEPVEETSVFVPEPPVIEVSTPPSIVEPESEPEASAPVDFEPPSDRLIEESIAVAGPTEETPVLADDAVPVVEEPTTSPTAEPQPEPEVSVPIEDEPALIAVDEPVEQSPNVVEPTEEVPALSDEQDIAPVVEDPAPSVESQPEPEIPATVEAEPISIVADRSLESSPVTNLTEIPVPTEEAPPVVVESASATDEPEEPEVPAPVESESISTAEDESNESTPIINAADETPASTPEEVAVQKPELSVIEPEPAPIPTIEEKKTSTGESTEEGHTLIVEESVPVVEEPVPATSEPEVEPEMQEPAPAEGEAPVAENEPDNETAAISNPTYETPALVAEEAAAPPTSSSAEPELEVEAPAPVEAEPTPIAVDELEEVPASVELKEETLAPQLSAAEPELAMEEVSASVEVEPIAAVAEEPVEESIPSEQPPVAEVSTEEAPVVAEGTTPIETTNVEEQPVEVEVAPGVDEVKETSGLIIIDETIDGVASKDDAVVIAENGNGHPTVVKEEEEPAKTTIVANNDDVHAVTPVEE